MGIHTLAIGPDERDELNGQDHFQWLVGDSDRSGPHPAGDCLGAIAGRGYGSRGLTQQDLLAAAKTYTPTGGRDEFIAFSSGGQSGQIMVYGVPSMRILKYVSVFTPEP
ncbi:MAG: hypothetical protein KDK10_05400, partial [Maritimibacter sp.]|nr:hypothetical protein [Maritimibacter sp.]